MSETRRCCTCQEQKPPSEFGRWSRGPDGLALNCRPCSRRQKNESRERNAEKIKKARKAAYHSMRAAAAAGDPVAIRKVGARAEHLRKWRGRTGKAFRYGISMEQWNAILKTQGDRCACCGSSDPGGSKGWHTDHDHEAGHIRGLLCKPCNQTIGHLGDSLESVQWRTSQMIAYLSTVPERMAAAGLSSLEPAKPRTFKPSPVVITEEPAELHAGLWC